MLNKVFKYIETEELADTLKFSADEEDAGYRLGGKGSTTIGTPDILWENIAFIQDKKIIWTHGEFYCKTQDLSYYLLISDYEEDINAIDEALSYAISEHEKDIKAIDEAVSYAISEHENRLNEQEYTIGFALNDLHNDVTAIDETVSYAISNHEETINALADDIAYLMDAIENVGGSIDLSSYVTKSELSEQSYLTEIPNTYATYAAITAMGYLTSQDISGLATESYVITKVADLVDSAPGTLDTLNELAAALGNDENFATTVATQIGEKVSKTELSGLGYVTQDSLSGNSYAGYSYVQSAYAYILNIINEDELVTSTALNDHNTRISETYSYVQSAYAYLLNEIYDNEYVTAYGLIQLNERIEDLEQDFGNVDFDQYALKSTLNSYAKKSDLNTYVKLSYAFTEYPSYTYLETRLSTIDLSTYVSKSELTAQSYVTKSELSSQSYLTAVPNTYPTYAAISNMGYVTQTSLSANSYAGYSYVYSAYTYINNRINDIDFIAANALEESYAYYMSIVDVSYSYFTNTINTTYSYIENIDLIYGTTLSENNDRITYLETVIDDINTLLNNIINAN